MVRLRKNEGVEDSQKGPCKETESPDRGPSSLESVQEVREVQQVLDILKTQKALECEKPAEESTEAPQREEIAEETPKEPRVVKLVWRGIYVTMDVPENNRWIIPPEVLRAVAIPDCKTCHGSGIIRNLIPGIKPLVFASPCPAEGCASDQTHDLIAEANAQIV